MTKSVKKGGGGNKPENDIFGDGNDAIAWAAQDSGVNYISHYPGSPVNRVVDVLAQKQDGYLINHALNEHIAALAVMGASLCGARSLLVMKHVGLNIAADPLNYSAVCKIKGGMVIVVGTDPGARSSTGEEDVHWYAAQFNLPLLEPATVQGTYRCVKQAFEFSEQTQMPVMVFVPGRIAYQSSLISRSKSNHKQQAFVFNKDPENLINVNVRAVNNHRKHILRLQQFQQQDHHLYQQFFSANANFGIVTRGASFSICHEVVESLNLSDQVQLLNLELTYPLNIQPFLDFAKNKRKIIIIEDQDGFLETIIKREAFGQVNCAVHGKDTFPVWGELSDQQIRDYFIAEFECEADAKSDFQIEVTSPERPGSFCEGCPHRSSFYGIDKALSVSNDETASSPAQPKDGCIIIRQSLTLRASEAVVSQSSAELSVSNDETASSLKVQKRGGVGNSDFDSGITGIIDGIIGGDIGCSSLPPHRTDWLLCMNAGIGISQGITHLMPEQSLVSTGGEGSFFHGGLISLQSAIENNINLTHIIFDNRSIAMTGHQDSPTSSDKTDMRKLLEAIGVNHIFEVNAFKSSQVSETILTAQKNSGVKVIWIRGDCALQPNAEALRRFKERKLTIHNNLCNGCQLCYETLQCPAIIKKDTKSKDLLEIDLQRCRRCTACLDVCPNGAIEVDDPLFND